MNNVGIGHNQGPPMGGLSTLPVVEKAIGGALIKGAKAGLKSLGSMFESVGSGLKKSGLKKDERKEAAKAIQNEIDKVSEANNRKFRPKILRMQTRPNQENNYSDVVIAAVDDENGKVAAVLDGKFFTKIDNRETFKTGDGKERKNKNFGKEINYLNVGGFFPIQSGHNAKLKEILESLNVPVYDKGEGVISPENLAILNKRQSEGAMGHRPDKVEMGTKGTLGFAKSLQAGLPVTDAGAGRISGAKGQGGELSIRGASIKDTAAPMGSLPDIDLSADLLEEMGDTGLRSLTPRQLQRITKRIVPSIGLPSNVKKLEAVDARMERVIDEASAKRDPYAARLLKEQDDLTSTQEVSKREPTIGELYSDETMIEKLQYALLNKLSGDLSGKKGLLSLVKRGDDGMIVGSRGPDDPGEVMKTAEGERLVPRRDFINPRIQKERVGEVTDPELAGTYESYLTRTSRENDREVSPEIQENARRFQEYREPQEMVERFRRERSGDADGITAADQYGMYSADDVLEAAYEGQITEREGQIILADLANTGRISIEDSMIDARRLRGAFTTPTRATSNVPERQRRTRQVGDYNDDGSVNVRLPDGTMTTTRIGPNDLGTLLNRVEDGIISPEESLAIVDALEGNVISPAEADEFRNMLDVLMEM